MAINPESQYPGKIAPGTPDYPYGAARNITLPGDGTGTPWEAALVNDIFGFQQALLSSAGIVPTGTPEKATDSQYLRALVSISGGSIPSIAEGVAEVPANVITDGAIFDVKEWHSGKALGGHVVKYSSSWPKSEHGVTGWSPTVPKVSDQAGIDLNGRTLSYLSGNGETDPGGTGGFEILKLDRFDFFQYGGLAEVGFDLTDIFGKFIELGGELSVSAGSYFIEQKGSDAGGVVAEITRSIDMLCKPGVKFYTDNLDNDFIRVVVPSNGSGLPSDGITVRWVGGHFDQSEQKVSTVVPFLTEYPAPVGKQGTSATCDGLSIRGDYNDGTEKNGIVSCEVYGVTSYAGDHWEIAGGDSAVFVSGCRKQIVKYCASIGARDSAVYTSGSSLATLDCDTTVEANFAVNCFHGFASKRSATGGIINNFAKNCSRAVLVDKVSGSGAKRFTVRGNRGDQVGVMVRAQGCSGFSISDNHGVGLGSLLSDGTTVEQYAGGFAYVTEGCLRGSVTYNTMEGLTPGAEVTYAGSATLINCTDLSGTDSENITWVGNTGEGLRRGGFDNGVNNSFIDNVVYNAAISGNMTVLGTNAYEQRLNNSTNARSFSQPMLFDDGTLGAPGIARASQTSVGVRFGTSFMAMTVNSNDRVAVDGTGVGFNSEAPIAKPTITGSKSGNAALANLVAALESYGLISDSTT